MQYNLFKDEHFQHPGDSAINIKEFKEYDIL